MPSHKVQRTFNYLDRFRLTVADIDIESKTNASGQAIAMVKQLKLPPASETAHDPERWRKAEVFVEVWRSRSANWDRIKLGTVGDLVKTLRSPFTHILSEFEGADDIAYRVKVVAADTMQLLAEADKVRPSNETDKPGAVDELIQVRKEPTLGEQPWKLHWSEDDGPIVLVSNTLNDCETFFTRDAACVAAMMPQIMRDVLFRLALDKDLREQEWSKKWFEFASKFDDTEPPEQDPDDSMDWQTAQKWADHIVQAFCNEHEFVSEANKFLTSETVSA